MLKIIVSIAIIAVIISYYTYLNDTSTPVETKKEVKADTVIEPVYDEADSYSGFGGGGLEMMDSINEGINEGISEGVTEGVNDGVSDGINDGVNEEEGGRVTATHYYKRMYIDSCDCKKLIEVDSIEYYSE